MKKTASFIKNNRLLVFALLVYLVLYFANPQKFSLAFSQAGYYLLEMARVMPIVFVMTLLIDAWVPHKTIQGALGKGSKRRGAFYAFLLGSLSAGPIYAAFPLGKMLFNKGASVRNVTIILSAWAVIKVPMLANELRFLGLNFMVVRWLLTVVAIYLMGSLMEKLVSRKDLPQEEREEDKDLMVVGRLCIGCGKCAHAYPALFTMEEKKAVRLSGSKEGTDTDPDQVISVCPVSAIVYKEKRSA